MAIRTPKSMFSIRPDERENIPFRLPGGTKERIAKINQRLDALNKKYNFELALIVEKVVERSLAQAEAELDEMEEGAEGGDTDDAAADNSGSEGEGNTSAFTERKTADASAG